MKHLPARFVSRFLILLLTFTILSSCTLTAFAEITDQIQTAIDAANTLSTFAFILPDGSLLADLSPEEEEFIDTYTTIGKIKKIEHTSHTDNPAVLTESGDLYVGKKLAAQNIQDMLYPEMKMSGYGVYFAADNTVAEFEIEFDSDDMKIWPRLHEYQNFTRFDPKTYEPIYFEGAVAFSTCDDLYYWVLDEEGRPYCYGEVIKNLYMAEIEDKWTFDYEKLFELPFWHLDLHTWSDLSVFAFASEVVSDKEVFTYAGIKKDGTVVACGERAEEILSWGPLVYIDGKDGNILGVTADGKLKLAGRHAFDQVIDELNTWSDIASAKLISGSACSFDVGFLTVTHDNTFIEKYADVWGDSNQYSNIYGTVLSREDSYAVNGYTVYNINH